RSGRSAASRTATPRSAAKPRPRNRRGSTPAGVGDCRSGASAAPTSIFRDRRVVVGPGVYAAGDVVDLGEAELAEVLGGAGAAAAAMAQDRQRGVLGQRLERAGAVVERLERARDRGLRALVQWTDVDDGDFAGLALRGGV